MYSYLVKPPKFVGCIMILSIFFAFFIVPIAVYLLIGMQY